VKTVRELGACVLIYHPYHFAFAVTRATSTGGETPAGPLSRNRSVS
jgi:hypothetical protein